MFGTFKISRRLGLVLLASFFVVFGLLLPWRYRDRISSINIKEHFSKIELKPSYAGSPPSDASSPLLNLSKNTVVMAKLKEQDTNWVHEHLPEWNAAIYIVDDPNSPLKVPKNKGKEGMAYLSYIIDYYDTLSNINIFIHSHRDGWPAAWHNDAPNYDNIISIQQLQNLYVEKEGYVNLRCNQNPGCPAQMTPNAAKTGDNSSIGEVYGDAWNLMFSNPDPIPDLVGVPCCAQFAVSKAAVRRRPKEDYIRIRKWLLESELEDEMSGRILEYTWHIIFGKDPVLCRSDLSRCYCDVYGRNY